MSWEVEVRPTSFEDLEPLRRAAKRERLSFKPTQNTQWFGAYIEDELVACGAVIWIDRGHTRVRMKSALTLPEWAGQGIGSKVLDARIQWAIEAGAKRLEVITRRPPSFLRRGWHHVEGKNKAFMALDL